MKTYMCLPLLCFLFLLLLGCSQSATIRMADGRVYEATTLDSDAQTLYVRVDLQKREFSSSREMLTKLKKNDVVEIDHPGNVHLLIGSILTGFGVLYGGLGLAILSDARNDSYNQLVSAQILLNAVVFLGVGVPMGIWGWSTWEESKSLSQKTDGFVPTPQPRLLLLVPTIDMKEAKMGLSLHLSF